MLTTQVENFPGFPQGILGPELMQNMKTQAERLGATAIDEDVVKVNFTRSPFLLQTQKTTYQARSCIIATGASARWLGVPGEKQFIGRGVSSCAPCDALFFKDKKVAVIGGGDSAMEEALVLTKFASQITVIHRRNSFRASRVLKQQVLHHPKVKVIWDTQVVQILGGKKVTGLKLQTTANSQPSWTMPIEGVFVAIGHTPNTGLFTNQIDLDEKGYIKVKDHTQTNLPGVFVAGDVHDYHYRQAVTAAGFGCMAAMDVTKWLEAQETSS